MIHTRRELLLAATTLAASGGFSRRANARIDGRVEAIAFDAFTIFDPRSVFAVVEESFPGRGKELGMAWQVRQFQYCWLRTLNRNYVDFWQLSQDALAVTFKANRLELTPAIRTRLMSAYLQLKPWPDSAEALKAMRNGNIRLAYLSNMTRKMLQANSENAGIAALFEDPLTTDLVGAYKPDPRAYAMAETNFKLPRENIVFAAFGGWDAAGARSFGLTTFWVNRLGVPQEELGVAPDAVGGTLTELARYVTA